MADQHNDNIPAVGNTIAADIPDIKENLEWHKDLLQMLLGWQSSTIGTVGPPNHRATFRYKDADEIYIGPGSYFHDGTTRQTVFWDSELTFQLGSGGSNAGSDDIDAGARAWHYIYLDDSAIVTNASPELDETCFLNTDVTAPTWSDAKHGWYNGSDRCIFAVLQTAGNAVESFYHDGGEYVHQDAYAADYAAADPGSNYAAEATLTIPAFARRAQCGFRLDWVDGAPGYGWWRNTDSSMIPGMLIGIVEEGKNETAWSSAIVSCNSSLKIDLAVEDGDNDTITVYTYGWFFPTGM